MFSLYLVSIFKTFPCDHAVFKHWLSTLARICSDELFLSGTWEADTFHDSYGTQGHSSIDIHSMPKHSDPEIYSTVFSRRPQEVVTGSHRALLISAKMPTLDWLVA